MLFADGSQDWKNTYRTHEEWLIACRKAYPLLPIVLTHTKIPHDPSYISATIFKIEVGVWRKNRGIIYSPLHTNLNATTYPRNSDLYGYMKTINNDLYRFDYPTINSQTNDRIPELQGNEGVGTQDKVSVYPQDESQPLIQEIPEYVKIRKRKK